MLISTEYRGRWQSIILDYALVCAMAGNMVLAIIAVVVLSKNTELPSLQKA